MAEVRSGEKESRQEVDKERGGTARSGDKRFEENPTEWVAAEALVLKQTSSLARHV